MVDTEKDILEDIADDDLPKLLQMYEKHKDSAPNAYTTILTGIEWGKKRSEKYLKFMSPNSCWREDGTFFVLMAHYSFDIFLFSLDDSGKNIYEGIRKTRRLDNKDRSLLLYCVHNKFYPIVAKAFRDKGRTLPIEIPCHMYSISREEALKFNTECPPEVYIKELNPSHAEQVNSVWPHRYDNSEKLVSLLIEMNNSYGVFLKSTNELACWIVLSIMGQLSMLQTADQHKKKGYASLITKYASKELSKKGHRPFGTVLVENNISRSMFEKLGFECLGIATYSFVSK